MIENGKYYNEKHKENFILIKTEENSPAINAIKTIFKSLKPHEEKLEKDIYAFDIYEILEYLNNTITSFSYFHMIKNVLLQYFEYSKQLNKDVNVVTYTKLEQLLYNELSLSNKMKENYFKDFNEFDDCLRDLINLSHQSEYNKKKHYLIAILIWYGVSYKDVENLTISDLNFNERTIYSRSYKTHVKIPNKYIQDCYDLSQLTTYSYSNLGGIDGMYEFDLDMTNENLIFKFRDMANKRDEKINTLRITWGDICKTAKNTKWKNKKLTFSKISLNGKFVRSYESGLSLNTRTDYAIYNKLDVKVTSSYNEYLEYKNWLKAFYGK